MRSMKNGLEIMKRNHAKTMKGKKPSAQKGRGARSSPKGKTGYACSLSLEELLGSAPVKTQEDAVRMKVGTLVRGELRLEDEQGNVFFCSKAGAHGALCGDTVLAVQTGHGRARVRRILEHAHVHMVGVLAQHKAGWHITPLERSLPSSVEIDGGLQGAQEGDVVRVRVVRWEDEGGLLAQIEDRIGSFENATCALDALIASMNLRTQFPQKALDEAQMVQPARLEDDPQREDLRGILSFTIDGRDAKDFDDAVSLERLENGHVLLGVHIADVGHYVPQGSALDREAYLRGTSVYFPGRVLPMLPEQLSNGVCSLRPDEDKFTLSALMEIDGEGGIVHARFARTITRSKARLVYDDVNAFFDGDEHAAQKIGQAGEALLDMRALARLLRVRRQAQGCIDFDTEEPQFILSDKGEPVEIVKRERGEAEMMIEDFMLSANECTARFARSKGIPLLYRVHERPDPEKLAVFKDFLGGIGVDGRKLGRNTQPGDIRAILEGTRERPEYSVISALALRSMQKARYDASPLGHYGLAMPDYCHFTSPIRRYPDLVVSRALTAVLTHERVGMKGEALEDAAMRSSDCERTAVEAERAADKIMMARLMLSHVGETFEGTVSGVSEWGVYVALSNGAEGFIHVRTLEDWFEFDERRLTLRGERTGAVFSLGQQLSVRVCGVELTHSAVDLELAGALRPDKARKVSERKRERERLRAFCR